MAAASGWVKVRQSAGPLTVSVLMAGPVCSDSGVRVGFATGKGVGNAVARNLVRRRLREGVRPLLPLVRQVSGGRETLVVVRATSEATGLSADELAVLVAGALDGATRRAVVRAARAEQSVPAGVTSGSSPRPSASPGPS